ncbi:hypothetical protein BE08_08035 [Sorangium cellulosum]|uniref:Transposase n=1 Tax=Sorangium cellulosum TaxID=56 RepID=A0A150PEC3_SORCE|nr:hypothetical protein BE08_08035 [Sorangium cellulosum]
MLRGPARAAVSAGERRAGSRRARLPDERVEALRFRLETYVDHGVSPACRALTSQRAQKGRGS